MSSVAAHETKLHGVWNFPSWYHVDSQKVLNLEAFWIWGLCVLSLYYEPHFPEGKMEAQAGYRPMSHCPMSGKPGPLHGQAPSPRESVLCKSYCSPAVPCYGWALLPGCSLSCTNTSCCPPPSEPPGSALTLQSRASSCCRSGLPSGSCHIWKCCVHSHHLGSVGFHTKAPAATPPESPQFFWDSSVLVLGSLLTASGCRPVRSCQVWGQPLSLLSPALGK